MQHRRRAPLSVASWSSLEQSVLAALLCLPVLFLDLSISLLIFSVICTVHLAWFTCYISGDDMSQQRSYFFPMDLARILANGVGMKARAVCRLRAFSLDMIFHLIVNFGLLRSFARAAFRAVAAGVSNQVLYLVLVWLAIAATWRQGG